MGYKNLWDFFSAAPSVNLCLKNSIKMRASCLFFIMKLYFDLTNAISTAGALYWPFQRLELPISGHLLESLLLQWLSYSPMKKPQKQSHLGVNCAFAHFRRVWLVVLHLAIVIHWRVQRISKLNSVHFRGLAKTF